MQAMREWSGPYPDFFEIAPENWIGVGGRYGRWLRELTSRYRFVCHGLSLDIGGIRPLDVAFLTQVRHFLDQHGIALYTEHLSYTGDEGHLYDLMPMPFTEEAVRHVAQRVRQVQDRLERRIALENVSYYASLGGELSEAQFINAVLSEADCDLLLDVNNVVVNSVNHGYDAVTFLRDMPLERVCYVHVAGHLVEPDNLRIDTHGDAVSEPVWDLLRQVYAEVGPLPTLLERDFNVPPLPELMGEVAFIRRIQEGASGHA